MAWYPDAVRKQLTVPRRAREKVRMPSPRRINFHTAVSNSTSIFPFFNSTGANGVFSHFYVRKDGTVEQYQDTAYTAACDLDGNPDTISIETWDGYRSGYPGYWNHDTDVPPWNEAQKSALIRLAQWIVDTHPTIPARLAADNRRGPSSYGFSWHRLGVIGAPGYVSRINGGLTYSLARGKVCPGIRRTAQIPSILAAVTAQGTAAAGPSDTPTPGLPTTGVDNTPTTPQEDDMTPEQEAKLDTILANTAAAFGPLGGRQHITEQARATWGDVTVTRNGEKLPIAQELANTGTYVIALRAELAGLTKALESLAAGQGVDMSAVQAAAKAGAQEALSSASVTIDLGGQS